MTLEPAVPAFRSLGHVLVVAPRGGDPGIFADGRWGGPFTFGTFRFGRATVLTGAWCGVEVGPSPDWGVSIRGYGSAVRGTRAVGPHDPDGDGPCLRRYADP